MIENRVELHHAEIKWIGVRQQYPLDLRDNLVFHQI
jgi:hypothetical protein